MTAPMFPFGETIRFRTRTRDADGDWTPGSWTTVTNVGVAPSSGRSSLASSDRSQSDRSVQITYYLTLYVPASAPPIPANAEIDCRGHIWTISAPESDWRSPFSGWHPGRELTIQRTEG